MADTVTLSQLITRLAALTDSDTNTTRLFLRAFFATIEENVIAGEPVTINGIGTFSRMEGMPGQPVTVAFIPDQALADKVNAPFAMFEPVELADNVVLEPDPAPESTPEPELEPEPVAAPEPAQPQTLKWPEEDEEPEVEDDVIPEPASTPEPVAEPEPEPIKEPEQPVKACPTVQEEASKEKSLNWMYIAALIVVIGGIFGYFGAVWATADLFPSDDDDDVVEEVMATDEQASAPTFEEVGVEQIAQPEQTAEPIKEETKEPVAESKPAAVSTPKIDTVTKTRFLATMAREYYGKSIYWVFIYEANKDRIANPNQIRPGLEVVIPDKSTFAEATEKETLRKAERLQAQIQK